MLQTVRKNLAALAFMAYALANAPESFYEESKGGRISSGRDSPERTESSLPLRWSALWLTALWFLVGKRVPELCDVRLAVTGRET